MLEDLAMNCVYVYVYIYMRIHIPRASPMAWQIKKSTYNAGDIRCGFDPWVGKNAWRRAWQPTPVFLPEESPWTKEPVGYSPWCCKELDMTERLSTQCATYRKRLLLTNLRAEKVLSLVEPLIRSQHSVTHGL